MTDSFDDADVFFRPAIHLRPLGAAEGRVRYDRPPLLLRWLAAGVFAAASIAIVGGNASAREVRSVRAEPDASAAPTEAWRRLDELKRSPGLPPGLEAPNGIALAGAERLLKVVDAAGGLLPERVIPDASGGVSLVFFGGELQPGGARPRYAALTATNEGDFSAMTHDRVAGATETWGVKSSAAQKAAVRRIQEFLRA